MKGGLILRVTVLAFRADMFSMIAVSFARALLPQMGIPWMVPKEIFELDSFGILPTLIVALDVYVLRGHFGVVWLLGANVHADCQ